jgi:hypothetical protein
MKLERIVKVVQEGTCICRFKCYGHCRSLEPVLFKDNSVGEWCNAHTEEECQFLKWQTVRVLKK